MGVNTGVAIRDRNSRPPIKLILEFVESIDGNVIKPGVIFRDVPLVFYSHQQIECLVATGHWILSTMGDCIYAWVRDGKMWVKCFDTRSSIVYPTIKLQCIVDTNKEYVTVTLYRAIFFTFTGLDFNALLNCWGESVDHINGDASHNSWGNLRQLTPDL